MDNLGPAFVTLPEAAKRLGLGRVRAYELAKAGKIPTVSLTGSRTLRVPESWLRQLEQEALSRLRQDGDAR